MKKCKVCKTPFTALRPLQVVCSPVCALSIARKVSLKTVAKVKSQERRATKAKRESLKTRAQWAKEAQDAFNRYVRARDAYLGCVSCDKPASWQGQWHASHFRSVGSAPHLRYHLWNVHKACSVCNNHLSGNLAEYAPRLVERIGPKRVDWLRCQHEGNKMAIEYLRRVKVIFTKKTRRLG